MHINNIRKVIEKVEKCFKLDVLKMSRKKLTKIKY